MMRILIGPFKSSQILDIKQKKNLYKYFQINMLKYYTQKANKVVYRQITF